MRLIALGLCALWVFGCTSKYKAGEVTGTGQLSLPAKTWRQYVAFQGSPGPIYMTVDPVSGSAYFIVCPENSCTEGDYLQHAIDGCSDKYNAQCRLFANATGVVWRGPVYVDGGLISTPEISQKRQMQRHNSAAMQRKRRGVVLNLRYRITEQLHVGKWRPGIAWMQQSEYGAKVYLELAMVAACDAQLSQAERVEDQHALSTGRLEGKCFDNEGRHIFDLEGQYESKEAYVGMVKAFDESGRQFDVRYQRRTPVAPNP